MNCTTAALSSRVWICNASFCSVSLATSAVWREKKELLVLFWCVGVVG
jgi:hypothetical protein